MKKNIFACICSILNVCISIIFLVYTLTCLNKEVNNLFWIINGLFLFLIAGVFALSNFMKKENIVKGITALLICFFISFNFLSLAHVIKIPKQKTIGSFVGKSINDLITFSEKNNIKVNQRTDFSDYVTEYYIISQDIKENTLLKDVKEINVIVSSGSNPDKTIILQSLVGLNIDEALKIIKDNFMTNISVDYEINEEIKKDVIISQNISGEVKRNDLLKLIVSLGSEEEVVPVKMEDLKDKSLFEAELWLKRNGFKYEIKYEFSKNIKRNYCLGQSEKAGTTVDPKETKITLIVSKGEEINSPDFTSMSVNEATKWISEHKLKVIFKEKYDNEIPKGNIISSNYSLNSKLEEGETVEITISKGKLIMESFDSIEAFRAWASSLNLEYEEDSQFDNSTYGSIIKVSPEVGQNINLNEKIKIIYSKGKSTTVPNFYNKSKKEASSLCNKYNLTCYYSYNYSNNVASENVVSQSLSAGSTVAEGTGITIHLSKGPAPKPVTCDSTQTHTLIIQPNWVTGGTADTTISTLKEKFSEKYPLVKFNFEARDGNLRSGFIHESSPISNNSTVQDCKTYTIIINK